MINLSRRIGLSLVAALGTLALAACENPAINGTTTGMTVGSSTGFSGNQGGPSSISADSISGNTNFAPGSQEELRATVGDRIFFDTDSSSVNSRARGVLDQMVSWMQRNPSKNIRIEGHADERGTRDYNLALGDRRANAVVQYLVSRGVSSSRLSTLSFGKERPVASGSNPTAWTQNRRAVFVVR